MKPVCDLDYLLPFCEHPAQVKKIQAVKQAGSIGGGAKLLGVDERNFKKSIANLKRKASEKGIDPDIGMSVPIAAHEKLKGRSSLVDMRTGETVLEWHKTVADQDKLDIWKETAAEFCSDLPKITLPKFSATDYSKDIIPWFQVGDAHIGMVAYEPEVGHNFDLKIAEAELCKGMEMLIQQTPSAERCVIHDLGDGTHAENFAAVTEASGHALDLDTRFPKMVHVYIRTMRYIIDRALEKFKFVDVIVNQGNHSRTNDIWMKELIRACYDSGRVHCLDNSSVFIPYRMGNTFVMTHHSDKCKPQRLGHVMATDFRQDWGETEYHYIDIGHIHHNMVCKEHPGVAVESWNQMAPHDKYAHDGGWRSRSVLHVVDRSKTYGELARRKMPVELVQDVLSKAKKGKAASKRRKVYTV